MPSNAPEQVRVVIDETSFDFRELTLNQLDWHISQFNDALQELRSDGLNAWKPPMFEATNCLDGSELFDYLILGAGISLDRDVKLRFFSLIDKCPEWDAEYPVCDTVEVAGAEPALALSVAFAATAAEVRRGVACLVFPRSSHQGFVVVSSGTIRCELFFFAEVGDLPRFWRALYELEDIAEAEFFGIARRAFPTLIFYEGLAFRRFRGSYRELRQPVVQHLGVLNDHFLEAHVEAIRAGRLSDVEGMLAAYGVGGVSTESVKTHRNARAMSQRYVEYSGERILCEWHTKLRPDVNRIHFAFGGILDNKILIGIFVDHLDLE